MSEIGSGSGSSYPGTLDTNASVEVNAPNPGKTKARKEVVEDLSAAIIAIETELGVDPAGSKATVVARIDQEHNADGSHKDSLIVTVSGHNQNITGRKVFASGISLGVDGLYGSAIDYIPNGVSVSGNGTTFLPKIRTSGLMQYDNNVISNFSSIVRTQLLNTNLGTGFAIDTTVTEGSWKSIGPTGSGADYTWSTLDTIPTNAKAVLIKATMSLASGGGGDASGYLQSRSVGGTDVGTLSTGLIIARKTFAASEWHYEVTQAILPIDSNRRFEIQWSTSAPITSNDINLYLLGWFE